VSMC